MEHFYSKIDPSKLLHLVYRSADFTRPRTEIIPSDNFIQCAALKLPKDQTFRAHRHITKQRSYENQIAQESWVIIKGKVQCYFYDLDDSLLATPILLPGDASFTLRGGHNYLVLDEETVVYEYKTGPYEGQQLDKEFLQ
jgi:hypothetical protein